MRTQIVNIKSTEFIPQSDYALIKPEEFISEEKSESGLIIDVKQKSVVDRPTSGIITAINEDSEYSVDDFVIWPETDGIDFVFNDGAFLLVRIKSIIGKKA